MRVVILTIDLPEANRMTQHLVSQATANVVGIVASTSVMPGKTNQEAFRTIARRSGPSFLFHVAKERGLCWLASLARLALGEEPHLRTLSQIGRNYRVPVFHTNNVNSTGVLKRVQRWRPDLLISIYMNQKIRKPLRELADHGVINVHPGLLPKNRGLVPVFWTLANGDQRAGVTVHRVDSQLDTGDVLLQREVPIGADDSCFALAHRCAAVGGSMLCEVIEDLRQGNCVGKRQPAEGASYYSWPDRLAIRRLANQGRRFGSAIEMWQTFFLGRAGDAM